MKIDSEKDMTVFDGISEDAILMNITPTLDIVKDVAPDLHDEVFQQF